MRDLKVSFPVRRGLFSRQVGEITVLSPYRMSEYFRDPAETRQALRDEWFLTGDLGWAALFGGSHREARDRLEEALEGFDALIMPVSPITAYPLGARTVEVDGYEEEVAQAVLCRSSSP